VGNVVAGGGTVVGNVVVGGGFAVDAARPQVFVRGAVTYKFSYDDPSRVRVADVLKSVVPGNTGGLFLTNGWKPLQLSATLYEQNIQNNSTLHLLGEVPRGMDGGGGKRRVAKRARRQRAHQEELEMMQATAAVIQAAAAAAALAAAESDDGDGDDGRSLPRSGGSNAAGRPDYWQSPWCRMLTEKAEELSDPASPKAKVFRRRFQNKNHAAPPPPPPPPPQGSELRITSYLAYVVICRNCDVIFFDR